MVVLACLLLGAACTDAGSSPEEYRSEANAVCRRAEGAARAQIEDMSPLPTPTGFEVGPELPEAFRRFWLVQRDLLRNILDGLDDLEPPATDRDTIEEMLASLRGDVAIGDRWLAAYEDGDKETLDELANAEIGFDFNRRADAYGLQDCVDLDPAP